MPVAFLAPHALFVILTYIYARARAHIPYVHTTHFSFLGRAFSLKYYADTAALARTIFTPTHLNILHES